MVLLSSPMPRYYFAFEWLDGSGKDTQKDLAIKYIQAKDKYATIRQIREPSILTDFGRELKDILKNPQLLRKYSAEQILELFVKDRYELSPTIRNALNHSHVISSRCFLSSYAYQQTQWLSFEQIDEAHQKVDIRYPDHILYFDISPEEAERRIKSRWETQEVFEQLEFQKKNREIYHRVIHELSSSNKPYQIHTINADGDISSIATQVQKHIDDVMGW